MRSKMTSPVRAARHLELLEGRTHFSATTWLSSSLSPLSGYSYVANIQVGEDPWGGDPSLSVATTSYSSYSWGQTGWGWADDGSFDSGQVCVGVTAVPGSNTGVSLDLAQYGTVSLGTGTTGFSRVAIQAAVAGDGEKATWSDMTVDFYRDGAIAEHYTLGSLEANTFDKTDGTPQQAVAVISAENGTYSKVVVSGTLQLQAQPGVYPGAGDVFGKVYVG